MIFALLAILAIGSALTISRAGEADGICNYTHAGEGNTAQKRRTE